MFSKRLARVRCALADQGADGLVVFGAEYDNIANIRYLSSFTGSFAIVVLSATDARLITDSRYFLQAEEESPLPLVRIEGRDPWPAVKATLSDMKIRTLAFETERLHVDAFRRLESLCPDLLGLDRFLMRLRAVKDASEIASVREACRIVSEAFVAFLPSLRPGRTEAGVAADLVHQIRIRGAQQLAKGHFVVASGVRGARPHGVFSGKVIETGDFVTFDFGAFYKGYVSDMTRTVCVGHAPARMAELYSVVLEAQRRALAAFAAPGGATGASVDRAAREHIASCGLGDRFTHSTGHGIGLEIHELPVLNAMNEERLPPGSTVTVEPGVYIEGLGGVRIEDSVLVEDAGCEVLTGAPKELLEL